MSKERNNKKRKRRSQIVNFLLQSLATCVGVAATFIGSYFINNHRQHEEIKNILLAVRAELQQNCHEVEVQEIAYTAIDRYQMYIEENYNSLNADSLNVLSQMHFPNAGDVHVLKWNNICPWSSAAFNMLKSSGRMANITLSIELAELYSYAEQIVGWNNDKYLPHLAGKYRSVVVDDDVARSADIVKNPHLRDAVLELMSGSLRPNGVILNKLILLIKEEIRKIDLYLK